MKIKPLFEVVKKRFWITPQS